MDVVPTVPDQDDENEKAEAILPNTAWTAVKEEETEQIPMTKKLGKKDGATPGAEGKVEPFLTGGAAQETSKTPKFASSRRTVFSKIS